MDGEAEEPEPPAGDADVVAEGAEAAPGEEAAVPRSWMRYRRQRRGGKGVKDIRTTERNGRVVIRVARAGSKPEIEWILVHSNASSKERGGRMVAIRFASIVFPEPGGPTRSRFGSERLHYVLSDWVGLCSIDLPA